MDLSLYPTAAEEKLFLQDLYMACLLYTSIKNTVKEKMELFGSVGKA